MFAFAATGKIGAVLDAWENKLEAVGFHRVFFIWMLFVGFLMCFLTPPFQVPDEPLQMARAYQIAEGFFISPLQSDGMQYKRIAEVPTGFINDRLRLDLFHREHDYSFDDIKYLFSQEIDHADLTIVDVANTGQYPPLSYLPQAAGIWIARLFECSAGGIFYLARMMSVVFGAFCIAFAVKLLPQKKFLITALASMPMFIAEIASSSADAVTYSLCFLIAAYIYRLGMDGSPLTGKQIIFLFLGAVSLGMLKQVYGVILFLFLVLPLAKFRSRRMFFCLFFSIVGVFLATSLAWIILSSGGHTNIELPVNTGADPVAQIQTVKGDVLLYLNVMFTNIAHGVFIEGWYYYSFVGILGWLTLWFPEKFYYAYAVVLFMGALFGKVQLNIWQRIVIVLAVFLSLAVIFLNQYLTWTPVGADYVDGVQGRYVIPISLMCLTAFSLNKKLPYENVLAAVVGMASAGMTIWYTYSYFY